MLSRVAGGYSASFVLIALLSWVFAFSLQAAERQADQSAIVIDHEDEDGESGVGIRLPWWGSKFDKAVEKKSAEGLTAEHSESTPPVASGEAVVIDEEDEDNESGFGIPIRFPGDKKSRQEGKEQGYEPVDIESYRVVIDQEDEDNESGFGIPLPTEDNPTPWRKRTNQPESLSTDDDD